MTNLKLSLRAVFAAVAGLGLAVVCAGSAQAENKEAARRQAAPQFSCSVFQGPAGMMAAVTVTNGVAVSQVSDVDVTVVTPAGPVQTGLCGLAFSSSKTNNAPFTPRFAPGTNKAPEGYLYTCSAHQASTNNLCKGHY
jgi:hypothetical protein